MADTDRPTIDAVAYEDVLAARVLRRALNALAVVIGFVVLVIGLAWRDLSKERVAIDEQRTALARHRDSLNGEVAAMRATYRKTTDSLLGEVTRAGGLVEGAQAYQAALAQQLVSFGRNNATMERTEAEIDAASSRTDAALRLVNATRDEHARRVAADTASLNTLRQELTGQVAGALRAARRANHLVLNRWSQVVEEERLTPVADSRFWVKFDDIHENYLTNAALSYDDGNGQTPVDSLPETLRVGKAVPVTIDGTRYEVLAQAKYRQKGPPFGLGHNDRVVFRIDRLANDSTLSTVALDGERRSPR